MKGRRKEGRKDYMMEGRTKGRTIWKKKEKSKDYMEGGLYEGRKDDMNVMKEGRYETL